MKNNNQNQSEDHATVLAIDPLGSGFGYAVLEGPQELIDWGVTSLRDYKHCRHLYAFTKLIAHYQPNVVVIKDVTTGSCGKPDEATKLAELLTKKAQVKMIPVKHYSLVEVQKLFGRIGGRNKEEIADAIMEWFPQLEAYRPPRRKAGDGEDRRINIFDATALAILFYFYEEK